MKPLVPARAAFRDPHLLGAGFNDESHMPMRSLLLAALGEKLTTEERVHFTKLTGREKEPLRRVKRLVTVAGRRSGKSESSARFAIYVALLCDHSENLSVGEKGIVLCVAQNMDQARVVFGYVVGIINSQPLLRKEVANITKEAVVFKNGIEIQVRPASFRGLRGMTLVAAICDEMCFWFTEENNSTNPDTEIVNAITPALMTTHGMLVVISSPYARRGWVWKQYSKHSGPDGDPMILVAQGASRDFNCTIDQAEIDEALEEDYSVAQAEWLGQFRTDVESFVSLDSLKACIVPGCYEIPCEIGINYSCFIDASTGAGGDSFACAIGHLDDRGDVLVVDAIRNFQPKFSPDEVVAEIADLCRAYNIYEVYSDNYASGFVTELFIKNGLRHEFVKENKSQLYTNLLSVINSRKIELLDDKRTIQELVNLERRTGFAGKDCIDHPPGCHDDSANVIAGLTAVVRDGTGGFSLSLWMLAHAPAGTPTLYDQRMARIAKEREEAERLTQNQEG